MSETTDAIRAAAFRLFSENGYAETSVDNIVGAAGVSRSSFFRTFGTKEAVIFPDHEVLLERVEARLRASTYDSALAAVSDAVRLVLFHYVNEGDRARERYRLTSSVPALRERELVSGARYQSLFRQYIAEWGAATSGGDLNSELNAELMAASVVAAHNRVLRRWLRDECADPQIEIDAALGVVRAMFNTNESVNKPFVIAYPETMNPEQVAAQLAAYVDQYR